MGNRPVPIWQIIKATAPLRPEAGIAAVGWRSHQVNTDRRPYPQGLYSALLSRIRADQDVTPVQAAMVKACLARKHRGQA